MNPPGTLDVTEAADNLAAGVADFLSSLPYMAPEIIDLQARVKLAEPLQNYQQAREQNGD